MDIQQVDVNSDFGFKITKENGYIVLRKVKFIGDKAIYLATDYDSKTKWSNINSAKQYIRDKYGDEFLTK